MPRGKSARPNLSPLGSTSLCPRMFPVPRTFPAHPVSVGARTVLDMAEQRSPHLRVVRSVSPQAAEERSRLAYWTKVQSLRDERRRLRAG
jgi:hypothetical protein